MAPRRTVPGVQLPGALGVGGVDQAFGVVPDPRGERRPGRAEPPSPRWIAQQCPPGFGRRADRTDDGLPGDPPAGAVPVRSVTRSDLGRRGGSCRLPETRTTVRVEGERAPLGRGGWRTR